MFVLARNIVTKYLHCALPKLCPDLHYHSYGLVGVDNLSVAV